MAEDTRQVLSMLSEGKISVDEAERLLDALRSPRAGGEDEAGREGGRGGGPKFLRVVVEEENKKVNVKVPIQLVRAGMKFGTLIPAKVRDDVRKHLSEQGIDFDFKRLKPEDLDELIVHLADLRVDVDDGGRAKVRVFCE